MSPFGVMDLTNYVGTDRLDCDLWIMGSLFGVNSFRVNELGSGIDLSSRPA
jgi:hypothetical protein